MIIYTEHAEHKLKRKDIKKFKINKNKIRRALRYSKKKSKTKYGQHAALVSLDKEHDLRIIYDIIDKDKKVITFHITRKGRY